ncbi:MAG: class I SAM-dependent methyltransferase [Chloroflexi bacterium]|nr:class I SAM-dependent methyltransferase [Chloroflexota bacterium]
MPPSFSSFFATETYHAYKNVLFNYLLRRRGVAALLNTPDTPVLDVGCGISPMVPDGADAYLGDYSFVAMQTMRRNGHRTLVLDVMALGLRSNSISTIVCSEVLEHVENDHDALRELHRVLSPGGTCILTVPLHQHYWHRDDEMVGHYRRYDLPELAEALQAVGFEVVRTQKLGSAFERYLTLAAAVVFQQVGRNATMPGKAFLAFFAAVNWIAAQFLVLASTVSPQQLNSLELLQCRKRVADDGAHSSANVRQAEDHNVNAWPVAELNGRLRAA